MPADNKKYQKSQKTNLNIFVSGSKTLENYENGLIYMFEQDYDDQKKVFYLRVMYKEILGH